MQDLKEIVHVFDEVLLFILAMGSLFLIGMGVANELPIIIVCNICNLAAAVWLYGETYE